ncbi:hypothetical protein CY0110_16957 [Crocosphaera chwakensis CCY0110]|uniref:Uncharacterized protein n=1 Tax=Crocosphaera chwakensis CCY0110 TaxID=391612 RepID=A3II73_9CHRO|nr:hypothetical protein CY0110_16957 [Crocosphaera chwakensis CCY0110]
MQLNKPHDPQNKNRWFLPLFFSLGVKYKDGQ